MAMPHVDEPFEPPSESEPQDLAAADFMERKGLAHLRPVEIEVLAPEREWLYIYDLGDGSELDLLVCWLEQERVWDVIVEDFRKP